MSTDLFIVLLEGLFTLVAALIAAWFALTFYYKQKEYELVKQRYLDGSIDVLASEIESALGIFNHNWARCLNILKAYRDQKDSFDIKDLSEGFIEYESTNFHEIAHHRLQTLTGSQVYWQIYQLLMAFVTNSVSKIQHEIPDTIKAKLTTNLIEKDHSVVVEHAFSVLKELQEESHKYAPYSRDLQVLSTLLEQEKLSVKKVISFRNKTEVINSVASINAAYETELEPYRENDA